MPATAASGQAPAVEQPSHLQAALHAVPAEQADRATSAHA
jgi:hypothetical protein